LVSPNRERTHGTSIKGTNLETLSGVEF
jgi:hypothetical protein